LDALVHSRERLAAVKKSACWICGDPATLICRHCGDPVCTRHAGRVEGKHGRCGKGRCKDAQKKLDAAPPPPTPKRAKSERPIGRVCPRDFPGPKGRPRYAATPASRKAIADIVEAAADRLATPPEDPKLHVHITWVKVREPIDATVREPEPTPPPALPPAPDPCKGLTGDYWKALAKKLRAEVTSLEAQREALIQGDRPTEPLPEEIAATGQGLPRELETIPHRDPLSELETGLLALSSGVEPDPSAWEPDAEREENEHDFDVHPQKRTHAPGTSVQDRAFEAREAERVRTGFYLEERHATATDEAEADEGDEQLASDEADKEEPAGGLALLLQALKKPPRDEATSREVQRSRRTREVRATTVSLKRMPLSVMRNDRILYPEAAHRRLPMFRSECLGDGTNAERPCPYISCAHHLFLDVSQETGAIKLNFPDLMDEDGGIRFDEMPYTCSADVADRGGATLEQVGTLINTTRERIRQIEVKALMKLEKLDDVLALRELLDGCNERRPFRAHQKPQTGEDASCGTASSAPDDDSNSDDSDDIDDEVDAAIPPAPASHTRAVA
jgi:hypothetical protein